MKIGIVRDTEFTNEPRGLNIARILVQQGHTVEVLCYGKETQTEQLEEGITLHRFTASQFVRKKLFALVETFPLYKYLWAKKIKQFVLAHKIEILHIHDLYMAGAAVLANKKLQLPMVMVFHENYVESIKTYKWATSKLGSLLTQPYRWAHLEKKYLPHFSRFLVTCDEFKNVLLKRHKKLQASQVHPYLNVPNLKDYEQQKDESKEERERFTLFYFGVVGYRRGVQTAIEAVAKLKEKIPNLQLLYIGPQDSDCQQLLPQLIEKHNIQQQVTYIPWLPISKFHNYVTQADVCISPLIKSPHHDTTIANKIFQYMLFSKPLLVSNSTPQEKIVLETQSGLVHKSEDAQDFADKVLELYHNPALCQKMGNNGKNAVLETYNLEAEQNEFSSFYNQFTTELNAR